jgi:hypothetical protein
MKQVQTEFNTDVLLRSLAIKAFNTINSAGAAGVANGGIATEGTLLQIANFSSTLVNMMDGNYAKTSLYFLLNGVEQLVTEDTVTPANNRPLPVKLESTAGEVTINAGNLYVQTSHTGATPDSMQIGDGTDLLAINTGGSINVVTTPSTSTTIGHYANANISNAAATQINATSTVCKKVTVTASELNTGWIRFGGSTVSATTGIVLYAGESYDIDVTNTNVIYAIAEVNGEDVSVTYYN